MWTRGSSNSWPKCVACRLRAEKESLLTSPLGLHRGGYLAGYLGIRGIWNRYCQYVPDAELVWMYLRSFFFDDRAFIDVILNSDVDVFDVHTTIIDYVSQRFALLASVDLLPALAQYHDDVSKRGLGDGQVSSSISNPCHEVCSSTRRWPLTASSVCALCSQTCGATRPATSQPCLSDRRRYSSPAAICCVLPVPLAAWR